MFWGREKEKWGENGEGKIWGLASVGVGREEKRKMEERRWGDGRLL